MVRDVFSEEVMFELRPEYQGSPLGTRSEEECAGQREQHVQRSHTEAGDQGRGAGRGDQGLMSAGPRTPFWKQRERSEALSSCHRATPGA